MFKDYVNVSLVPVCGKGIQMYNTVKNFANAFGENLGCEKKKTGQILIKKQVPLLPTVVNPELSYILSL